MSTKGIIISGKFGEIVARQKSDQKIELGELLVAESDGSKFLMQAFDLVYGSQLSSSNLELVSGLTLEEDDDFVYMDKHLRNYTLAQLKSLITINQENAISSKSLPEFFSNIREVKADDLKFITKPKNPVFAGKLRSGSRLMDIDIFLPGDKVFTHHILIPATTGKGKSNMTSVMLWDMMKHNYCGILILDPHDEYYGRNKLGLRNHPNSSNLVYYTPSNPPSGAYSLKINLECIKPEHFNGVVNWSDAQSEALTAYYRKYREKWISAIVSEQQVEGFMDGTISVLKRRMNSLLNIGYNENGIYCKGIFDDNAGKNTITEICKAIEEGKKVIIDTSSFSGNIEILIGSLIATEIFSRYKFYKNQGILEEKAICSILLEEAPRVLGKEVLEKGSNIFSSIAREGRKFKIGLIAITQLPSLIPRTILANMNTKIVLGIEMSPERQAVIESAAQDLSSDSRAIASLDKGEAIITSNFTRFAIPVKIPLFSDYVKADLSSMGGEKKAEKDFAGVGF